MRLAHTDTIEPRVANSVHSLGSGYATRTAEIVREERPRVPYGGLRRAVPIHRPLALPHPTARGVRLADASGASPVASSRFVSAAEDLRRVIDSHRAVMVMVDDGPALTESEAADWERFSSETAGRVATVRVSRAALDDLLGVRSSRQNRYYAFANNQWPHESPVLTKRPFCDWLDCPRITMPSAITERQPPLARFETLSLGLEQGPAPLSLELGSLQACYLAAALMAMSTTGRLSGLLRENYDGTLSLTLPGRAPVTFDSRLYVEKDRTTQLYSRRRSEDQKSHAWGPFIEKGIAALTSAGYSGLERGIEDAMLMLLTGKPYRLLDVEATTPERLLEILSHAAEQPMTGGSWSERLASAGGHAFAIYRLERDAAGEPYVVVGDPRGDLTREEGVREFRSADYDAEAVVAGQPRSEYDGVFRLSLVEFRRTFRRVALPADLLVEGDKTLCTKPETFATRPIYDAPIQAVTACKVSQSP